MSVLGAPYPCSQMALFGLISPLSRYKTVSIVVLLYNILFSSKVDYFFMNISPSCFPAFF